MLRLLLVLAACSSLAQFASAKGSPVDPERSWNEAVDRRARDWERQQTAQNDAIKLQSKTERTAEALRLASQATGEPESVFVLKCESDCTLKNSGTATFYMRIILQSRDKVCRYNAWGDDHGCGSFLNRCDQVSGSVECLDRVR